MRWRLTALISLGLNLVLLVALLVTSRQARFAARSSAAGAEANPSAGRTNFVVRQQLFSWRQVESEDFPTYIANLRAIGCPEPTIRDIIIAEVNGMFSKRLSTELVTPAQQWWRSEPDTNVLQAAAEKARALEDERRTLLTRLLGPDWEAGDLANLPRPTKPGIVLDGSVLGALPAEAKETLQEINAHSEERMQSYLNAQAAQGRQPDAAEIAKLRQQTRAELARILSPLQLEEFLLRYSGYAESLRADLGQLRYFNATPEEFRAIFRTTDAIQQQIETLAASNDANSAEARRALEAQRENSLRLALGPRRYEEYRLLHDPLYREAMAQAIQAGTPDAARVIYQVNLAAAQQQAQINSDPALSASQKNIELKQLELDQMRANTLASGQELPPEPPATPAPPPRRTYTLRQGDSLATIALIHGVPVSAIRAANPNLDLNRLRPGDSVNIPRAALGPGTGF